MRTLLAAVFDNGSVLTIQLEPDERLQLVSDRGVLQVQSDRDIIDQVQVIGSIFESTDTPDLPIVTEDGEWVGENCVRD